MSPGMSTLVKGVSPRLRHHLGPERDHSGTTPPGNAATAVVGRVGSTYASGGPVALAQRHGGRG